MSDSTKHKPVSSSFTQFSLMTQPEMLETSQKEGRVYIGIPKETTLQENRVALVPSSVMALTSRGHRVVVESGAGLKSNFSDRDYSEAGADIAFSREQVFKADVILKVAPPTIEEIDFFHHNQVLISPLQIPLISAEYILKLRQKRVIALAMEYIKDDFGTFPVVRIMSEIAGTSAILTAAELLIGQKGQGVLLGGISGVPPSKVVILGAGVVAEFATRTAIGLGAEVRIFDNNIYKLMRLQNQVGRQLFTSVIDPHILEQELRTADVAIGAIHSKSGRTPMLVSENMVMKMKPGSVIIDVSIDQGGSFETSEVTSHDNPTFVKHDIIHYCVPNIASKVPRTASYAISHIITPLLLKSEQHGNIERFLQAHPGLLHGVYTYKGCLTNAYLSQRFQIKYTDLDLLITSSL
jgi:alanine dehydrogenase